MSPDTLYRIIELIAEFYNDLDLMDVDEELAAAALISANGDIVEALNIILEGYCGNPNE